jgi:acylphosphatase
MPSNSAKQCIHCIISGQVQGVYFRASTTTQAKKLHLTGWVRNLPSGQVEIIACGDQANLAKLLQWLQQGPPLAKVSALSQQEIPWQQYDNFSKI